MDSYFFSQLIIRLLEWEIQIGAYIVFLHFILTRKYEINLKTYQCNGKENNHIKKTAGMTLSSKYPIFWGIFLSLKPLFVLFLENILCVCLF